LLEVIDTITYLKINVEVTMISLVTTRRDNIHRVIVNGHYVGELITKKYGAIRITAKDIFRELNAFGISTELLIDDSVKFKFILIKYEGKIYYTTRELFKCKGEERTFHRDGEEFKKTFLHLDYFKFKDDPQLSLSFD